jgi:hypothetical protein
MTSNRPRKVNTAKLGEGVEELWLMLTSKVGGDGLRATETRYPTGQEGTFHSFGCDFRERNCFRPARDSVNCSEAVGITCGRGKWSDKIDVDVKKTGRWQCEISHKCNCVAGDFGALADLTSSRRGAAILMDSRPRERLCDEFRWWFSAGVRQIVDLLEYLEA